MNPVTLSLSDLELIICASPPLVYYNQSGTLLAKYLTYPLTSLVLAYRPPSQTSGTVM